jgi:hypothetical protein
MAYGTIQLNNLLIVLVLFLVLSGMERTGTRVSKRIEWELPPIKMALTPQYGDTRCG